MSEHPPIQIVDENDKPTGSASITEARQNGLWHRIVRIMIEDDKGRLLLQKRSDKVRTYPGCWDTSAAGHVDAGESYLTAAKRELAEETGLETANLEEIASYKTEGPYKNQLVRRFNKTFETAVSADYEFALDPKEVAELRWFSRLEAKRLTRDHPGKTTDGLKEFVARCLP